jgi:ribosomal protein L37AE/L43A
MRPITVLAALESQLLVARARLNFAAAASTDPDPEARRIVEQATGAALRHAEHFVADLRAFADAIAAERHANRPCPACDSKTVVGAQPWKCTACGRSWDGREWHDVPPPPAATGEDG